MDRLQGGKCGAADVVSPGHFVSPSNLARAGPYAAESHCPPTQSEADQAGGRRYLSLRAHQTRFINGNIDSDFVYTIYLLLKDGTYYEGIPPVALEEWDIAASRAATPKEWGRWQRKANGRIVMRPGDASRKEYTLNGLQATPAKPGERLDGVYSTLYVNTSRAGSRTSSSTGFVGLHFFSDGRFQNKTSSSFLRQNGGQGRGRH